MSELSHKSGLPAGGQSPAHDVRTFSYVDVMGSTFIDRAEATAQGVWLKPNPDDKKGAEIFLTTVMLGKIIAECERLRANKEAAASAQGAPADKAAPAEATRAAGEEGQP